MSFVVVGEAVGEVTGVFDTRLVGARVVIAYTSGR